MTVIKGLEVPRPKVKKGQAPLTPSQEMSIALDCLHRARFRMEGEKEGPKRALVRRAADALDKIIPAIQRMKQDFQNNGL